MFSQITEKIVGNMVKQNLIQQENKSIYQYGINQLFNMTLNIVTFLIVGILYHMILQTIIFTAAYIPLRIYAGGFHASTPFKCWIVSGLMLVAVLSVMKYLRFGEDMYDVGALAASLIILILSPVEDKNKPLDEKEELVYKVRCIIVFFIEAVVVLIFKFFQFEQFAICMEMVWISLSCMLLTGKAKNLVKERKCR